MTTRRFLVAGRVQGVGFRWFVSRAARRLGLEGYAKNLPDGRVEVLASGNPASLDELRKLLGIGPQASQVSLVEEAAAPEAPNSGAGFSVR